VSSGRVAPLSSLKGVLNFAKFVCTMPTLFEGIFIIYFRGFC